MIVLRKPVRSLDDEESCTLASLRDGLLPRLMRGEVRVKDLR
jgi:hypothetical protein